MKNQKQLIKTGVMARRLGVTVAWLREEAAAGKIPSLKAGNVFLFNPEAVEKVLVQRATQGGDHAA